MATSFLILLFASILAYIEVTRLLKRKMKKEAWSFSILLLFSVSLAIAFVLDADIPNPLKLLTLIYQPLLS
ncbi:hypothetical protein [Alkalihalobacterium alkalinitrilicum]|uniref:hypothetical protein n=1 Tax=Alkalihalobacterium alkalinitrilicum TaxID=427920 RepID=UPI001152E68D|nr:hypothetical protein [Alkalihalobacterium alkalinitrilicum]